MITITKNSAPQGVVRCAFYGRFSSVLQRRASIEDQLHSCRERAAQKGWVLLDEHIYRDEAKSGTSRVGRDGLLCLEKAAERQPRPFDCVLIDDSSRLGRDVSDTLLFERYMRHFRVKLYLVAQSVDTSDAQQLALLPIFAAMDANHTNNLKRKVSNAHSGRFRAGYHIGSIPYGYKGQRIADESALSANGQAATLGTKLFIIEDEAVVVRNIMVLFAVGRSMMSICRELNQESVPWPIDGHRSGRSSQGWTPDTIKRMLHNERYAGIDFHKKSFYRVHPKTGQTTKEFRPEEEVLRRNAPELRIVSDELWTAVQTRLRQLSEKNAARIEGGYSRAKNTPNPWSGCFFCGLCGRRMTLGGKQGLSTYGCPNYRCNLGCKNKLRIRAERASEQVADAVAELLDCPGILDQLVAEVYLEMQKEWKANKANLDVLHGLRQRNAEVDRKLGNLSGLVEDGSGSAEILKRLRELEGEKVRLISQMESLEATAQKKMGQHELKDLVKRTVKKLNSVLKSDSQTARELLQKRIRLSF